MTETKPEPDDRTNAPIDAEFEVASPPAAHRGSRRGPGWLAFALLTLLSGAGLGLALAGAGLIPALAPASSRSEAVRQQVATLEAATRAQDETLSSMATRLDTLTDRVSALGDEISDIRSASNLSAAEVAALKADLETARAATARPDTGEPQTGSASLPAPDRPQAMQPPSGLMPDAEAGEIWRSELDALKTEIASLQAAARADETTDTPRTQLRQSTAEAALAIAAIEAAARRGRPFEASYIRLAAALPDDRHVAALAPLAADGAMTLAQLRDEFDRVVISALDADARAEGGAARWARSMFGDGVTIRRPGKTSAADELDAVGAALERGELTEAINRINRLAPPVQTVFTDWLEDIGKRRTLEQSLEGLRLAMLAREQP